MRALGAGIGALIVALSAVAEAVPARLKELARVEGVRDNPLVGYGLVVGLAGTGDSPRNQATLQSVANVLSALGLVVPPGQLNTRDAAVVTISGSLPPFANVGDRFDVQVAAIGDARSLAGGSLLMAPLQGADAVRYAVAQGSVSVGGYSYDSLGNAVQKNHPTAGIVALGASVERAPPQPLVTPGGALHLLLLTPDFTTSSRIAAALAAQFGAERLGSAIVAEGPDRVVFRLSDAERRSVVDVLRRVEALEVAVDPVATVVVNERTGTVVSGGDVRLEPVSVTQGELSIRVDAEYTASQPTLVSRTGDSVRTILVPNARLAVREPPAPTIVLPGGATVADLALALHGATPRELVTVLQALRAAGALHARLVIQ